MPTANPYDSLPNKEAIVAFNGKALLTTQSYLDLKAYQHALAFTVAGLMDEDLLKETRDAIASALENGIDFRTFKRRLKPYLMSKGWLTETLDDGTQTLVAGSNRRLRTIYSTNLQTAYSAGQWSRIQQTKEWLPYLQYMPSVSENPRLEHKKYYGLCRPADDVIWQYIMPPNGWGCKCWVKQLTRRQAEKVGISEPTALEMEEYENPKTGEKSQVPVGIDPSFNHNFDRLTAILRLAEDRHGKEFAKRLSGIYADNLPEAVKQLVTAPALLANEFSEIVFFTSGADDGEFFNQEKFAKIVTALNKQGVDVEANDEIERFLAIMNAQAGYVHDLPNEAGYMLFNARPTRTQVIEEILHYGQHRKLGFRKITEIELVELEIEAQEKLLIIGKRLGWTDKELSEIERAKVVWQNTYQELTRDDQ